MLTPELQQQVREFFNQLMDKVKLVVFTQEGLVQLPGLECASCRDNRLLMEELSSLSDKIEVVVYDFVKDREKVEEYGVDKIPATVVEKGGERRVRFFGWPGGYEFASLLHAIKMVSTGESGLSERAKQELSRVKNPVHIQVFVTPTCPYCPMAVQLAHAMAVESPLITADMVNASDFPHLANRYGVYAVPKTVINEGLSFEGAAPEAQLLNFVLQAGGAQQTEEQ